MAAFARDLNHPRWRLGKPGSGNLSQLAFCFVPVTRLDMKANYLLVAEWRPSSPSGVLGLVVIIIIVMLLMGRL